MPRRFLTMTASLGGLLAACAGGPALVSRAPVSGSGFDAYALLAVSDLDMAATGYADRKLRQTRGQRDQLTILRDLAAATPQSVSIPASNSVVGWPGPLALSPDMRFALVVETQGEIDDAIEIVDNPSKSTPGRALAAFDIWDLAAPRPLGVVEVCGDPAAVEVHASGRYAVIACRDAQRPLAIVPLTEGVPGQPRPIALALPDNLLTANEPGLNFARLNPDGRTLAVNVGNRHIVFLDLAPALDGVPATARIIGAPVSIDGAWLSMARWSKDGRFLVTADTAWGPGALDAVLNGPGRIVSIAFVPEGGHRVVSEATVSLSPEGFEFDPAGTLLAVVNMERTYLPPDLPYALFDRRDRASLSLVSFDPATGALRTVDGPLAFDAVLPEDVVFDDAGDTIAVVSFHERSALPQTAWVELFEIDRRNGGPRLAPTGVKWPLPRGAHDLAVIRRENR